MTSGTIHTPRAVLRRWTQTDVVALLQLFQHPHTRRYLLDGAVVDHAWMALEIASSQQRFAQGIPGLWTAWQPQTNTLLGVAGFRPDHQPPVLELIYAVAEQHTGTGLATHLAQTVMAHARQTTTLGDIHAAVDVVNVASVAVLSKLGFVETHRSPGAFGDMLHLVARAR
jgi:RimJ/RimL family protein N-acetyltransferase